MGPPGTGKTTYLVKQIEAAREKHGAGGVLVVSFTKAAAAELNARVGDSATLSGAFAKKFGKADRRVGTLHSLCYTLIGCPKIAETKIAEFNSWVRGPGMKLTPTKADDPWAGWPKTDAAGDEKWSTIQKLRARCIHVDAWPQRVKPLWEQWCKWKEENGYVDFTDMIEDCWRNDYGPPDGVKVAFVDEAQDFTRLQLRLIEKWADKLETVIYAFDEDQTIFGWSGADPAELIDSRVPEENRRILSQSYRVPASVHRYSQRWIKRVSKRIAKEYKPRDEEGAIRVMGSCGWKGLGPVSVVRSVQGELAAGRDCMILATCAYMLSPVIAKLKEKGIPFHNPYRKTNGSWNPLRESRSSSCGRLMHYLKRNPAIAGEGAQLHMWTAGEAWLFAEHWSVTAFKGRGMKTELKKAAKKDPEAFIDEADWFAPEYLAGIARGDINTFLNLVLGPKRKAYRFPAKIAAGGMEAMNMRPKVVIGTVHSVKGGEAASVYVFPDLGTKAGHTWQYGGQPGQRDEIRRVFYVAFTRARENLFLCGGSSSSKVNW